MNDATGTKIGHVQLSGSPGRYELLIDGQRIECAERGFSITFDGGVPIVWPPALPNRPHPSIREMWHEDVV